MVCPCAVPSSAPLGSLIFLIVCAVSWERGMTLYRSPLSSCFSPSHDNSLFLFLSPSSSLPLCLMQLQYNNSVWVQQSRQVFGLNKHPWGHVLTQQPPVPVSQSVPLHWGPLHNTFLLMHPVSPSASQPARQPNHQRKNTEHGTVIQSPDIEYHLLPSPQSNSWFPGSGLVGWERMSGREGGRIEEALTFFSHICNSPSQHCNILISSLCLYEGENNHCTKTRFDVMQLISLWHQLRSWFFTSSCVWRWKGDVEVGVFLSPAVRDRWLVPQRGACIFFVIWEWLAYLWKRPSTKCLNCQCNC